MKKFALALLALSSFSAFAGDPQLSGLSKEDVEKVSQEFGANFSHTVVAAPETNGAWGVEVGVAGGMTGSPDFKKVISDSGGKGSDFKNIYHAGVIGRVHIPFDLFAEVNYLPEQEIGGVKIKNSSFGVGWNVGGFFNLPLDIALGYSQANGELQFHQDADGTTVPPTPEADIKLSTKSNVTWVGVSKTFLFITPYVKAGTSKIDGDLKGAANVFDINTKTQQSVSTTGGFLAGGVNLQLFIFKLGFEAQQMQGVKRVSGKLSFDF